MTDAPGAERPSAAQTAGQGSRLLVDVGPVVIWIIVYNVLNRIRPDDAIFLSGAVFAVLTVAALVYARLVERRFPPLLAVSATLVSLFVGAALIFRNELFFYLKPTVMNLLYAAAIFGSLLVKQNVWKFLFGSMFVLPDRIWNILAIRWGLWFIFLAILNEVIWRNFSEEFWMNTKIVVVLLTLGFAMANVPITMKHGTFPDDKPGDGAAK